MIHTRKPNKSFNLKYTCSKCRKVEYRSIGQWKVECSCGGWLQCTSDPWKPEKDKGVDLVKNFRKKQKWSQELLALELGVDQGTVSRWERGTLEIPRSVKEWIERQSI